MERKLISSGSTFEAQIGYSHAVVDGEWVFVSGTTGFNYATMAIPDDLLEQIEQCLKNIEAALQQAGSRLEDVVRVTYVLPNGADFERCWPVLRKYFGEVRPAAMMISAGLSDPRMKIEIEVTARIRSTTNIPHDSVQVVTRFNEALNVQDVNAMMRCMTQDCVFENTAPPPDGVRYEGQAAVRAFWDSFFQSSTRPRIEIEDIFALGERCVMRWKYHWVDQAGVPGSVRGVDLYRLEQGLIAEKLSYVKG